MATSICLQLLIALPFSSTTARKRALPQIQTRLPAYPQHTHLKSIQHSFLLPLMQSPHRAGAYRA